MIISTDFGPMLVCEHGHGAEAWKCQKCVRLQEETGWSGKACLEPEADLKIDRKQYLKLSSKRYLLRRIRTTYLKKVREKLWAEHKIHSWEFELLIASELLWEFLEGELNEELDAAQMTRVSGKNGKDLK